MRNIERRRLQQNLYAKNYRALKLKDNSSFFSNKTKESNEKRKKEFKKYVWEYLLTHPCVDCGEKNPVVLEFDHVNVLSKKFDISNVLSNGNRSLKTFIEEIEKCDVRCANCHRMRTAKEFNWWKYRWKYHTWK